VNNTGIITAEMLAGLPGPVQRYMSFSGVVGRRLVKSVIVKQTGRIRLGPEKRWMHFGATESYSVDPPSFTWDARVGYGPLSLLAVRDSYVDGKGAVRVRLANLFQLLKATGPKVDDSSAVRYLSEVVWFPSAFLGNSFAWSAIDDSSAQVSFSAYGRSVSGRLYFAADGRPTNFVSKRYKDVRDSEPLSWSTPATAYGSFCGLTLPSRGQAVWHMESGDFTYIDLRVDEITYDSEGA
jgi:hypothetical protein